MLEFGDPDHPSVAVSPSPFRPGSPEGLETERDELAHWRKICNRNPEVLRGLLEEKNFLVAKLNSRPGSEAKAEWHRREIEQIEMVLLEFDLASRTADPKVSVRESCNFERIFTNFFRVLMGFETQGDSTEDDETFTTNADPRSLHASRSGRDPYHRMQQPGQSPLL